MFEQNSKRININLRYDYDNDDIDNLLFLRCCMQNIKNKSSLLIPFKCVELDHLSYFLKMIKSATKQANFNINYHILKQYFLLPINIKNVKRSALLIEFDINKNLFKCKYVDSLASINYLDNIPNFILHTITNTFGKSIIIENILLLRQNDYFSDGLLTIENLILASQNKNLTKIADNKYNKILRLNHINFIHKLNPKYNLLRKQKNNINQWTKTKNLTLSLSTHFRDRIFYAFFFRNLAYEHKAYHKLISIPFFRQINISNIIIKRYQGGSNITLLVKTQKNKFIMRITRNTNPKIQNFFQHEGDNITKIQSLNIGPKLIFHNKTDGTILLEYINNIKTLSANDLHGPNKANYLMLLTNSLNKIHCSQIKFKNNINILTKILKLYEILTPQRLSKLLADNCFDTLTQIISLKNLLDNFNIIKKPCHGDVNPFNCLVTNNGLKLIDWERSGNGDPAWDLAYLASSANLNSFQKREMISIYNKNINDQSIDIRIKIYKPMIAFWKTLWLTFLAIDGNDLMPRNIILKYAKRKLSKCKKLLQDSSWNNAQQQHGKDHIFNK